MYFLVLTSETYFNTRKLFLTDAFFYRFINILSSVPFLILHCILFFWLWMERKQQGIYVSYSAAKIEEFPDTLQGWCRNIYLSKFRHGFKRFKRHFMTYNHNYNSNFGKWIREICYRPENCLFRNYFADYVLNDREKQRWK